MKRPWWYVFPVLVKFGDPTPRSKELMKKRFTDGLDNEFGLCRTIQVPTELDM